MLFVDLFFVVQVVFLCTEFMGKMGVELLQELKVLDV